MTDDEIAKLKQLAMAATNMDRDDVIGELMRAGTCATLSDALTADAVLSLLARLEAAEHSIDSQCWEHANNCCSDWCDACRDSAAAYVDWRAAKAGTGGER